jgi:Uma2 family endonuclease
MHQSAFQLPRRQFTGDEVDRMVEAGILAEDERVELLGGDLIVIEDQGPRHLHPLSRLMGRLARCYGDAFLVQPRSPIDCGPLERPAPDLALYPDEGNRAADHLVCGDELLLAVEVAWTSQALDHRKATIYARAGVPEYWLLDVAARRLEIHRSPTPAGHYEIVTLLAETQPVTPPGLDVVWRVADLLPAPDRGGE